MFNKLLTYLGLKKEEEITFTPLKEVKKKKAPAAKTAKKPAKKAPTKKSK